MGYFSNGSEGMDYQEQYCTRCIHDGDCSVWDAHMLFNYEEGSKKDSILNILIPRKKNGFNDKCRMFVEQKEPVTE